jgi:chromosomal replication initiator protein
MEIWSAVTEKLQSKLSTPAFKTFITSTKLVSFEDGVVTLAVPSDFVRFWVKDRCEPTLQAIFQEDFQQNIMFQYQIKESFDEEKNQVPSTTIAVSPSSAPVSQKLPPVALINNPFNPKYTFDTFVVGNGNRFAHAASIAVAEKPSMAYNPLFTCGGSGLGKTHLMHAIGQKILTQHPHLKVLYIKAEDFVNEMIDSIQDGGSKQERMNQFRNKYRTVDVLMIDDIQFLMGKERSQEEFFHAFNTLYESKKQIVLNSDRPPRELHNLEDRLKSRFSWGLITDIQPPDLETRIAILHKKIDHESMHLSADVIEYVAKQVPSNIRDLEGAITRIAAHASLTGAEPNIEFAAQTLKNLFAVSQDKHITISVIKQVVAEYFKIDIEELSAKVRTKDIAMARQIAMFLAKEMTSSALSKIGNNFGGRDHTTVLHACDKIKESIKTDPSLLDLITRLKKEILSR